MTERNNNDIVARFNNSTSIVDNGDGTLTLKIAVAMDENGEFFAQGRFYLTDDEGNPETVNDEMLVEEALEGLDSSTRRRTVTFVTVTVPDFVTEPETVEGEVGESTEITLAEAEVSMSNTKAELVAVAEAVLGVVPKGKKQDILDLIAAARAGRLADAKRAVLVSIVEAKGGEVEEGATKEDLVAQWGLLTAEAVEAIDAEPVAANG